MNSSTVLLCCVWLLLSTSYSKAYFSEESLKDLGRLPHLQRHWAAQQGSSKQQRLSAVGKVTTPPPPPLLDTTTQESPEVGGEEQDESDSSGSLWELTTIRNEGGDDQQQQQHQYLMSISLVKEKLKARKLKGRNHHSKKTGREQDGEDSEMVSLEAVEVKKHIQRMSNSACSVPSPRLIYIRQEHHGPVGRTFPPNVRYLPECTWLHRCGDDAGCCLDESKTCSAANIQTVSLPFFILTLDTESGKMKRSVVRLTFENHTSCECVGRNSDLMPRTEAARSGPQIEPLSIDEHPLTSNSNIHRHHHNHRAHPLRSVASAYSRYSSSSSSGSPSSPVIHLSNSKCLCPSSYSPSSSTSSNQQRHRKKRHRPHNCSCHCKHRQCSRLKRGLESFSLRDRGCISEKKCQVPSCDHGHYITFIGRCPRREEKSQSWLRLLVS